MNVQLNATDSQAAGVNVAEVHDFLATVDFSAFERDSILPLEPRVVFCRVPAEDIPSLHQLESLGFRFAEFQLSLRHRIPSPRDLAHYPYHFERVTTAQQLEAVLELAGTIFTHDRFTTDPEFGPEVSGRRYQAYVQKSFNDPEERIYVMKNNGADEVVSFATLRQLGPKEVRLLLGGVANDLKQSGMGVIHDHVGLRAYYDEGIRVLHTCVSGISYPIMNLEIAHLGFKVVRSHVVLKKRYA